MWKKFVAFCNNWIFWIAILFILWMLWSGDAQPVTFGH